MSTLNKLIHIYEGLQYRVYRFTVGKVCFKKRYKKISKCKIYSIKETAEELVNTDKSIGRYGDGELSWMLGKNNGFNNFEKKSKKLSDRLLQVFQSNRKDFIVTLPDGFRKESYNSFTSGSRKYWEYYITKKANKIYKLFNYDRKYFNTSVTRPYIDYNSNEFAKASFSIIREVWRDKKVLIIEGNQSRLGYNDDLFDDCYEIKRIECPAKNAFEIYDEILNKALSFLEDNEDYITLISLGPTATILAYDLCCSGHRAIDIGHIDVEYEWYLIGAKEKINLSDKYVNEVFDGKEPENLIDRSKDDEIIYRF